MIRLAIVEDEEVCVNTLIDYLKKFQSETEYEIETVWFRDGCDITDGYKGDYDVILMDIQMKFMDGMSAAQKIREMDTEVVIVFITNMTDYAIRGYEVGAMDYIVKPITYFAFCEKMKRILKRVGNRKTYYISIPIDGGIQKMDISSIYYVESQRHNLIYKLPEMELRCRGTMNELEKLLVPYGFFRNSKSFLVNIRYVEGIRENECIVHGESLPIGRAKKKEFLQELLNHMNEVM